MSDDTLCVATWGTLAGSTQTAATQVACMHPSVLFYSSKELNINKRRVYGARTSRFHINIFWNTLQSLRLLLTSKKAVAAPGYLCLDLLLLYNCSRSLTCCCP